MVATTFLSFVVFVAGMGEEHLPSTRWIGDSALPGNELAATPIDPCALADISGKWGLSWDDGLDGEKKLVGEVKSCAIDFKSIDGKIAGTFDGPVAGRERNAIIEGHLFCQPAGQLLVFNQRENGYVCTYQIFLSSTGEDFTQNIGTWQDTQDRSGNFSLLKYQ